MSDSDLDPFENSGVDEDPNYTPRNNSMSSSNSDKITDICSLQI